MTDGNVFISNNVKRCELIISKKNDILWAIENELQVIFDRYTKIEVAVSSSGHHLIFGKSWLPFLKFYIAMEKQFFVDINFNDCRNFAILQVFALNRNLLH